MFLSRPSSSSMWFIWHAVALALATVGPLLAWMGTSGAADPKFVAFIAATAAFYLTAAIALTLTTRPAAAVRVRDVSAWFGPLLAAYLAFLAMGGIEFPRVAAVLTLVLVPPCLFAPLVFRQSGTLAAGVTLMTIALVAAPFARTPPPPPDPFAKTVQQTVASSNYYSLLLTWFDNYVGPIDATGGGITLFGDRLLVASGDGALTLLTFDGNFQTLDAVALDLRVPINRDEFLADVSGTRVVAGLFRTADVLARTSGDRFDLYAVHHYWDRDRRCVTARISTVGGALNSLDGRQEPLEWRTLFETSPCLPIKDTGMAFAGHQIGGRLALLDDRHLLFSVGDHEMDGVSSADVLPQDTTSSYGKVIAVDVVTGDSEIFSRGHRNPQGLIVDSRGDVWETEHGPNGGDELNLLVKGGNYGWPLVTYGALYESSVWPLSETQGEHSGFDQPLFAWVPSIGISSLVDLRSDAFSMWRGDLLVSSLEGGSLMRVRVRDGRAVVIEPIHIGRRIRDIVEVPSGRLVLWVEDNFLAPSRTSIVVVEPAESPDALVARAGAGADTRTLVLARCAVCHALNPGDATLSGPSLVGVANRTIASLDGYAYSDALRAQSGRWTRERLEAFLFSPQEAVPGTTMQFAGVTNDSTLALIVDQLMAQQ